MRLFYGAWDKIRADTDIIPTSINTKNKVITNTLSNSGSEEYLISNQLNRASSLS